MDTYIQYIHMSNPFSSLCIPCVACSITSISHEIFHGLKGLRAYSAPGVISLGFDPFLMTEFLFFLISFPMNIKISPNLIVIPLPTLRGPVMVAD
jgi:hypothetical protein